LCFRDIVRFGLCVSPHNFVLSKRYLARLSRVCYLETTICINSQAILNFWCTWIWDRASVSPRVWQRSHIQPQGFKEGGQVFWTSWTMLCRCGTNKFSDAQVSVRMKGSKKKVFKYKMCTFHRALATIFMIEEKVLGEW